MIKKLVLFFNTLTALLNTSFPGSLKRQLLSLIRKNRALGLLKRVPGIPIAIQYSIFQRIRTKYLTRMLVLLTGMGFGMMAFSVSAFVQWEEPFTEVISWLRPPARLLHPHPEARFAFNKEKNAIIHNGEHDLRNFYRSLDSISHHLRHKVNVVHIGDSHIQADIFTGQLRQHLQADSLFGNGGRGMVFPHSLTGSNNSFSLKVSHTGRWTGCKNAEWSKFCDWGIAGVTATTRDATATVTINPNAKSEVNYDITKVRIFYPVDDKASFLPLILNPDAQVIAQRTDAAGGYVEFSLRTGLPEITIGFEKTHDEQTGFTLQGISLENDKTGLEYHSLGINGVDTYGFLRSPLLEQHLAALYPDLVIISLGTNDAYTRKFDAAAFKRNYGMLIQRIRRAVPGVPILLTTPGDCMLNRYYPNYNTVTAGKVIMDLAEETNCAVWDLFNIMGGLRSINVWCASGLAVNDRLHFTTKGYTLQGDLLYDALIQDYVAYSSRFPMKKTEMVRKK